MIKKSAVPPPIPRHAANQKCNNDHCAAGCNADAKRHAPTPENATEQVTTHPSCSQPKLFVYKYSNICNLASCRFIVIFSSLKLWQSAGLQSCKVAARSLSSLCDDRCLQGIHLLLTNQLNYSQNFIPCHPATPQLRYPATSLPRQPLTRLIFLLLQISIHVGQRSVMLIS